GDSQHNMKTRSYSCAACSLLVLLAIGILPLAAQTTTANSGFKRRTSIGWRKGQGAPIGSPPAGGQLLRKEEQLLHQEEKLLHKEETLLREEQLARRLAAKQH